MKAARIAWIALVAACLPGPPPAAGPVFYDDDPLWIQPVSPCVPRAVQYEPDNAYGYFMNYFGLAGARTEFQRARNVNTVDEVPDGPFFVNRAGRLPLTPALVARAANTDDGPAGRGWEIVSGKSDGVTPGFTIRDARGVKWYLKFDPRGWPAMGTGSEIVGAKLFWALGFHTAEYHIVRLRPSDLTIGKGAEISEGGKAKRLMRPEDVTRLLDQSDRAADGTYRAVASKALPGRYVGRIRYEGTRADDPNDLVPHEHHRELRGYAVFAAWLNHVDVKNDNSLVTLVTEGDRSFVRTYLLDFGSILGSAGIGPRREWEGSEPLYEPLPEVAKRVVSFGLRIPAWRLRKFYVAPAVGRLPADESAWNPDSWRPRVTNSAFLHARADDKFWAAYKMTFITEEIVRAAVAEARFGDPAAEERLIKDIMDRRARILETYLAAINPIVEPALSADGMLTFRNAAVEFGGAAPPRGYRAVWRAFDNETETSALIGATESAGTELRAPELPRAAFIEVELACTGAPVASWEKPITLHFRRQADGWRLVGLVRMPESKEE